MQSCFLPSISRFYILFEQAINLIESFAFSQESIYYHEPILFENVMVKTLCGDTTKNDWVRVLYTLSQFYLCAWLISTCRSLAMWSRIFDIFMNVAMSRKHFDTFARCSDGIDVHSDFKLSSKWTITSDIMKKDPTFVPVDSYVLPASE